jgi:hypothetical protein
MPFEPDNCVAVAATERRVRFAFQGQMPFEPDDVRST